jgi:hypothetical protein
LTEAGIGSRSRAEDGVITILVLRAQLEEARFVLATVSFAEPATLNAPPAETGRARWSSPVKRAASVVVAALLLTSIFLLAPRDTKEPARCPGGETTHLIAPWAGCDAPKDEVAPGDG